MAVQLSASYLRRSYQLLAKLNCERMPADEAFERAGNIVYEWGKQKFSKIFRQMPYLKATFDDKRDGNEIGVIAEAQSFIFRGAHPDARVPGRMWITDVQVQKAEEAVWFAVRLSVTSLQACEEPVPFSKPGFIWRIMEHIGLCDGVEVSKAKHLLSSPEDVDAFAAFLESPERHMPVVLLTPCYFEGDGPYHGYMMDADRLAVDLAGIAHVYRITAAANEYLNGKLGKQWTAFNGAVRTYYPDLRFEESDWFHHPFLTQQSIRLRDDAGEDPLACMADVEEYVQQHTVTQRMLWEEKGIIFYLAAHQDVLRKQRSQHTHSQQELVASFEEQIEQMQKQCDENFSLAESYLRDCESYAEELDQQRKIVAQLKAKILTLQSQMTNVAAESVVPINGTYADMAGWIARCYPDRLRLHPRAARSLKNAVYGNVTLVYQCLELLATAYYDYRMGFVDRDVFVAACQAVDAGLEERAAITDVAAGMQGETYFVQYKGKRKKLERHLTKGNNKDRRLCLRIYFFWDEVDEVVVLGDLPHHLDTVAT